MIVDTFRPDPEGPDHLYLRWRDTEGNLVERTVDDYRPYFWVSADTDPRYMSRVLDDYFGSSVDWNDTAVGLRDNQRLVKVYAYRESDLRDMSRRFRQTWEADIPLADKYLIDHYPRMPKWKPRVWHFDLEWDPETKRTTVMAVADNYNNRHVAFCWKEGNPTGLYDMDHHIETRHVSYEVRGEQVEFTYERHLYGCESDMHRAFLDYMDECNPDVFVAHALMWADLPHLIKRLKQFRRLSPLNRVIGTRKGYGYGDQPIIGRLCFDTASPLGTRGGPGFERVWKDSGKPQLKNLKLDTIAQACGLGGKFDMDVFTGWTERFDEYVDYCMQDTILLKRIDEDNHVLDFFLSLQELCGVSFASCHNVTRFAKGLLNRRTEWKAPSRSTQEKQDYEGAFIPPPRPGRYEGVACVDYKGLYPSLILSHNLSWETQVSKDQAWRDDVRQLPDGTCWVQGVDALLPSIVTEMFEKRDEYKRKMREAATESERNGWNTLQLAVKRVMASFYGMTASAYWGWSDFDIASAITACGRQAIRFLMSESEAQGYDALYGHTDSAFVKVPLDEADALAKHLTTKVQHQLEASHLIVELEAYMPYWIVGGKNLYYGICSFPPEDDGKVKSARWGKISTLSPISKDLENDVLTAICNGAEENEVIDMVRPISKRILRGDFNLKDVASTTRLQKDLSKYEKVGGGIKAAIYYNEHVKKAYSEGSSVDWVYVRDNRTPVMAFEDESDLDGYELDVDLMVDKLVKAKLKPIFKALEWDLDAAAGAARPKQYFEV